MNAGEFGGRNTRTTMSSSSNTSIAKKARTKAEADFTTWLMMAKLGGFDDLPPSAQNFLINYRARLETMSEAESTALAIREVYSAYYSELGGVGAAPEPQARKPKTERKVERLPKPPKPQTAVAARTSSRPMIRRSLQAFLIFASMVALVVTYRFLTQ
jgi:hypothetical protein